MARIVDKNSGKNLDVINGVVGSEYPDGNSVQIKYATNDKSQCWYFEYQTDGTYKITNAETGLSLDVYNGQTNNGNIGVYTDSADSRQRWRIYEKDGYCVLKAECSDDVMSVSDSSEFSFSEVMCDTFTGADSQMFQIETWEENAVIYGDSNKSGGISIADVTYIQMGLVDLIDLTQSNTLADVDGDGEITVRDATYIQLYLAKRIAYFPCEKK